MNNLRITIFSIVLLVLSAGCIGQRDGSTAQMPSGPQAAAQEPLKLHPELEKYRDRIEKSVKPFIRIAGTVQATGPWDSKFAGDPYLPRDTEYPQDAAGKPMKLLAQINFGEVPDIGVFPKTGILEFFISVQDDVFGLDFDNPLNQANFRLLYFKDVVKDKSGLVNDFGFVNMPKDAGFPVSREARLSFTVDSEPVSFTDFRFERLIGKGGYSFFEQFGDQQDKVAEFYTEAFPGSGHKMGGYAFFTQWDPREKNREDYDILLFQMDSDESLDIMWGDTGVANFFIKKSDLDRMSFSDVLYNWDCY
jgi:uncharacterized protein YwqG